MMIADAAEQFASYSNVELLSAKTARPVLFLTINNGAAHTKAAEAIASAWQTINREIPTRIVEVSEFMSRTARFTHISAYLWLIKNAPRVWTPLTRQSGGGVYVRANDGDGPAAGGHHHDGWLLRDRKRRPRRACARGCTERHNIVREA